jgi:hypothetical protein
MHQLLRQNQVLNFLSGEDFKSLTVTPADIIPAAGQSLQSLQSPLAQRVVTISYYRQQPYLNSKGSPPKGVIAKDSSRNMVVASIGSVSGKLVAISLGDTTVLEI